MRYDLADLSRRLGHHAKEICQKYLSNGRQNGNYWIVGSIRNEPGGSTYIALFDHPNGSRAGRWTDAATGERGDLIDLITISLNTPHFEEVIREALQFIDGTNKPLNDAKKTEKPNNPSSDHAEKARKLFALSSPIRGTLAETYLKSRGIDGFQAIPALRFHPSCYYHDAETGISHKLPALIAAITNHAGLITAVHRTWLDPLTGKKASIPNPKKSLGEMTRNAVHFDPPGSILAIGEGLETMLSFKTAMPEIVTASAITAQHLNSYVFHPEVKIVILVQDNDPTGQATTLRVAERALSQGILPFILQPDRADLNDDLVAMGHEQLHQSITQKLQTQGFFATRY
jgi:hypothetical protein